MRLLLLLSLCALSGCVNSLATLVNDKNERITCSAQSYGMLGSMVMQTRYDNCVADAKQKGYRIESEQK